MAELTALVCPDCGRERNESGCHGWMDCMNNMRDQLTALRTKLTKLEAAARVVVAADTYVTPGKSRFEATTEAIGKLETLLPQLPAQRDAAKAELEKVRG